MYSSLAAKMLHHAQISYVMAITWWYIWIFQLLFIEGKLDLIFLIILLLILNFPHFRLNMQLNIEILKFEFW